MGAAALRTYCDSVVALGSISESGANTVAELLESLDFFVGVEGHGASKQVDLLLFSCYIARLMKGGRTTSCKSAKDRTSMFHTLEVVRLAERLGVLPHLHEGSTLARLRGLEGVRLRNCEANIGRAKYSFNQIQFKSLPVELRPPTETAFGGES